MRVTHHGTTHTRGTTMDGHAATEERRQVQLSFRIPAELATALERVAALEDRTVSAELRRLIRRHVAEAA
jgi:hypothetical protein